jgi:hypothetical protein
VTSRPIPAHGTLYRYNGPRNGAWAPCRCPKCVARHSRACALRDLARLRGEPPLHPAGPLVEHIEMLVDSGMTYRLIAARANVARGTVSYLARGISKGCHRAKALRILAVQPADLDEISLRPVLGSERRVRALYAIGHGPASIAKASGLDPTTISYIANGHWSLIGGRVAFAVQRAYRLLASRPGNSAPARRRARQMGWNGPLAWDDIDDPNEQPEVSEPYKPIAKGGRDDLRRQEIRHLLDCGESVAAIAKQMGCNEKYIGDLITQGLPDSYQTAA